MVSAVVLVTIAASAVTLLGTLKRAAPKGAMVPLTVPVTCPPRMGALVTVPSVVLSLLMLMKEVCWER